MSIYNDWVLVRKPFINATLFIYLKIGKKILYLPQNPDKDNLV